MILDKSPADSFTLNFTLFLVLMSMYFTLLTYYGFLSFSTPARENNEKTRFSLWAIALTLFFAMFSALIALLPFESQMLAFINEHGIINVFFIMMNYLYSPNTEDDNGFDSEDESSVATSTISERARRDV
jgi:hypothetical protein